MLIVNPGGEAMQNLMHNRGLVMLVLGILIAVAVVLIIAYSGGSGGGHAGGGGY